MDRVNTELKRFVTMHALTDEQARSIAEAVIAVDDERDAVRETEHGSESLAASAARRRLLDAQRRLGGLVREAKRTLERAR